ncbi:hypothetical protein HOU95_gp111 [Streptomyces phage Hiyaa]|uniref:Uncharacterized protein n=1 Tax=Streptomyces phage Hiyaa TaxID=2499072 RepID=A0A3S9U8Q6_9CAUD|nr:hypothetical protein HOU95_gp111 [Streptomyces phage Hiyaa]AZS06696.1 hypothetical protein SEA_HIYAA_57 [Streptomyces phage Hiyaa]
MLPMTDGERRADLARLFRIVIPETREVARTALANMLEMGTLRQSSATRLFQDLWQDPADYFSNIRETWRARAEGN